MESKKSIRLSPLKINKESRSIRKPPVPLPMIQYRRPVIIHTYSPKIIETDANNFMWLVQRLTGSSDTRIRCENSKPEKSPANSIAKQEVSSPEEDEEDDKNLVQVINYSSHQIHAASNSKDHLLSPTSSADSGFFGRFNSMASPKSPLLGSFHRETSDSSAAVYVPAAINNNNEITIPWSPAGLPTPSHEFLTEFSSVFGQEGLLDLTSHSSVGLSPHTRFFGALPSPATMAYRDLALSFIKDPGTF